MYIALKSIVYLAIGFIVALIISAKSFGAAPAEVEGTVKADATWSGEVLVVGDVLVPEGVSLTVAPGTKVMFQASESSKIEPVFLSMQTEIMVRGKLVAGGVKGKEITFGPAPENINGKKPERGDWGGVIFDGPESGNSKIINVRFTRADTALAFYSSSPDIASCTIDDCRYGIVSMGGSTPKFDECSITGNEFGVVSGAGSSPTFKKCNISKNEHDILNRD